LLPSTIVRTRMKKRAKQRRAISVNKNS
jgi:hypothetical protein